MAPRLRHFVSKQKREGLVVADDVRGCSVNEGRPDRFDDWRWTSLRQVETLSPQ
jgi:hypothetical protein